MEEKKNSNIFWIIIVVLLAIICGLVVYIVINTPKESSVEKQAQSIIDQTKETIDQTKETINEKTKVYVINYTDISEPGWEAIVTIDSNAKINVVKQIYCGSVPNCKDEDLRSTYTLDFDADVKKNIIDKYIPKVFGNKDTVEINSNDEIDKDVENFLNAIFEKDQSYIK